MSNIYNIKNWSDVHLKEDDNDSDELTDAKHVERKWRVKARREEEDWRKAEAARKAVEKAKRKAEEEERRKVVEAAAEEESKKQVSNLLPRATTS